MLNNLKITASLCVIFVTLSTVVYGQRNFDKGYVITLKNDTLYGEVSDRKLGPFGGIYDEIRFKGKRRNRKYQPKEIKEYKIGETIFRTKFLDGEFVFLKLKTDGFVTHYVYELQEQGEEMILDIDYLQKGPNANLVRVTQGIFGLKKKRLARLFYDCPPLVEKILNKEVKYTYELVDFYNKWIAQ